MSDSDDDLLPSNVYTYQNESTAVCAKGPNVNTTNITGLSFRNNVLPMTMNMPWNFERQRYSELNFDQRSMSYRRETSPMSMYSDMRTRNFQQSVYRGMSSQRSMYNGRSGSPMSMRSMDSNSSEIAAFIAMSLKNDKFNRHELNMIKDAYNKFIKGRIRKRYEKRRNMRLFLKGYRRKSGYNSGEQGSESSISSDDCRSTSSAMYKGNMSSCRSTRTNIADFRHNITESNMYKNCSNNFQRKVFKNNFAVPPTNKHHNFNYQKLPQNQLNMNQKERFQNSFLLPSQRFNKSVASVPIPESNQNQVNPAYRDPRGIKNNSIQNKNNNNCETDSDQEEIFSEVTVREKSFHNPLQPSCKVSENKRSLALEDNVGSDKKRTKISSPAKENEAKGKNKSKATVKSVLKEDNSKEICKTRQNNDFEFIKPQFPAKKSGAGKFKEKLISKSALPLTDAIMPPQNTLSKDTNKTPDQSEPIILSSEINQNTDKNIDDQSDTGPHSNSDLSMRPSFIKRKLFSQKLDVTEKKTLSAEVLNVNSPQNNVYSTIQREKNKARKVVTNQSCLNRDVQDDNNLLDLIHKIVPPDQMNVTNMTNKTSLNSKPSQEFDKNDEDDKWDVTSIISTCNKDDISETFTDEEIFNDNKKKNDKSKSEPKKNMKLTKECKLVIERSLEIDRFTKPHLPVTKSLQSKNVIDNQKSGKSFWDTDFESDLENSAPKRSRELKENHIKVSPLQSIKNIPEKINTNLTIMHNATSLSESLKCKTNNSILDNNMGNIKKYNINRNLTIKSFRAPKHVNGNKKLNNSVDVTLPSVDDKQNNKNKYQNIMKLPDVVNNKKAEMKKTIVNSEIEEPITNSKQKTTSKTKLKDSTNNKKTEKQIKIINKPKNQNNSKANVHNKEATRTVRTPKKKLGGYELEKSDEKSKSTEKLKEIKNSKLNNSISNTKLSKRDISVIAKGHAKQSAKNKKENVEPATDCMNELAYRTLRTRKIDLSSSIDTSDDNMKNITIRSLRLRKINLSSSINNSSIDGKLTVMTKNPNSKNKNEKKTVSQSNRNETKRMAKNNCVKG
ncbi:unnamed protein product [Diatraea saccharalis]|uniref:Uncharacterized protein n=1 Tax=Diatraea saccharalis TaxID=40085 RepID=A0A9N9RFJ2_9NEOP|nr:unnamed protein product [Diatraea saccharalis]